jgi:hypothetical protein
MNKTIIAVIALAFFFLVLGTVGHFDVLTVTGQ